MKSTFVFLAVFLLGFVCLGYADDGAFSGYPQSGTVFPLKNEYIQMVSEEVIYKDGQFTTTFEFLNTSNKEQEVTIGFPVVGDFQFSGDTVDEEPKTEEERLQKISSYYQFKSFIDGKEIERTLIKLSEEYVNEEYQYVFITKYRFLPLQKVIVKNMYNQSESYGASTDGNSSMEIEYILKTGSLWKDNINLAKIVFYLKGVPLENYYMFAPDKFVWHKIGVNYVDSNVVYSKTYKDDKYSVFEWDFSDFKPIENIRLSWGTAPKLIDMDFNAFVHSIESSDVSDLANKNDKFFYEMQSVKTFYSYVTALAQLKVFVQSADSADTYGDITGKQKLISPRFLINSLYALKGYKFNKPEWSKFYRNFKWYKPIPDKPEFSQKEKDLIAKLTKLEKENVK